MDSSNGFSILMTDQEPSDSESDEEAQTDDGDDDEEEEQEQGQEDEDENDEYDDEDGLEHKERERRNIEDTENNQRPTSELAGADIFKNLGSWAEADTTDPFDSSTKVYFMEDVERQAKEEAAKARADAGHNNRSGSKASGGGGVVQFRDRAPQQHVSSARATYHHQGGWHDNLNGMSRSSRMQYASPFSNRGPPPKHHRTNWPREGQRSQSVGTWRHGPQERHASPYRNRGRDDYIRGSNSPMDQRLDGRHTSPYHERSRSVGTNDFRQVDYRQNGGGGMQNLPAHGDFSARKSLKLRPGKRERQEWKRRQEEQAHTNALGSQNLPTATSSQDTMPYQASKEALYSISKQQKARDAHITENSSMEQTPAPVLPEVAAPQKEKKRPLVDQSVSSIPDTSTTIKSQAETSSPDMNSSHSDAVEQLQSTLYPSVSGLRAPSSLWRVTALFCWYILLLAWYVTDPSNPGTGHVDSPAAQERHFSGTTQHAARLAGNVHKHTSTNQLGFELKWRECASSPCQNGGRCIDGGCTYSACFDQICTCIDGMFAYECVCPVGFRGAHCELSQDACASMPCVYGSCQSVEATPHAIFKCVCEAGFSGPLCAATATDPCISNPCLGGGTCTSMDGHHACICNEGWTGARCELSTNDCEIGIGTELMAQSSISEEFWPPEVRLCSLGPGWVVAFSTRAAAVTGMPDSPSAASTISNVSDQHDGSDEDLALVTSLTTDTEKEGGQADDKHVQKDPTEFPSREQNGQGRADDNVVSAEVGGTNTLETSFENLETQQDEQSDEGSVIRSRPANVEKVASSANDPNLKVHLNAPLVNQPSEAHHNGRLSGSVSDGHNAAACVVRKATDQVVESSDAVRDEEWAATMNQASSTAQGRTPSNKMKKSSMSESQLKKMTLSPDYASVGSSRTPGSFYADLEALDESLAGSMLSTSPRETRQHDTKASQSLYAQRKSRTARDFEKTRSASATIDDLAASLNGAQSDSDVSQDASRVFQDLQVQVEDNLGILSSLASTRQDKRGPVGAVAASTHEQRSNADSSTKPAFRQTAADSTGKIDQQMYVLYFEKEKALRRKPSGESTHNQPRHAPEEIEHSQAQAPGTQDPDSASSRRDSYLTPTLHRADYYTIPTIKELAMMPAAKLRAVRGFRVGRVGYGEVRWLGETDVTGVDLDDIVFIEEGDVSVYMDDSDTPKPPVGTKLNKPAVVVLERIFPPAGVRPYVFARELEKSLESVGAWSVEYDAVNGKWAFTVPHFSM